MKHSIEPMQIEIGQQRRDDPSLWCSLLRPAPLLPAAAAFTLGAFFLHHRSLQPHPDQFLYRPIGYSIPHTGLQFVMWNRVEVPFQVRVIHRLIPGLYLPAYLLQRLVGRASRPEPIGAVFEIRFKDRLQNQQGRRLHHTIAHRRYPQRPQLPIGFLAQLLPQQRDFPRQPSVPARSPFFRSGSFFLQAVLLPSCSCLFPARPLRSLRITGLLRYYGPLRLPAQVSSRSYGFLQDERGMSPPPNLPGLPSSYLLCPCALSPFTPECFMSTSASCFLMTLSVHPIRRTGRFHLASRGRIGFTCVTAHRFAARGFARKIALPCARLATCRIGNYKVNSFQFTRSDRLLGAPNTAN